MSPDGRTDAAYPINDVDDASSRNGARAAGTASAPIEQQLRRGLRALISAGRMYRFEKEYRSEGGEVRIPLDLARRMKARRLAAPGFAKDMVATQRGRDLVKMPEVGDAVD